MQELKCCNCERIRAAQKAGPHLEPTSRFGGRRAGAQRRVRATQSEQGVQSGGGKASPQNLGMGEGKATPTSFLPMGFSRI